jgi:hypothetical protein
VLVRRTQWKSSKSLPNYEDEGKAEPPTSGLGNRFLHPTPAYSDSLRPTPAKDCQKPELWLE